MPIARSACGQLGKPIAIDSPVAQAIACSGHWVREMFIR